MKSSTFNLYSNYLTDGGKDERYTKQKEASAHIVSVRLIHYFQTQIFTWAEEFFCS